MSKSRLRAGETGVADQEIPISKVKGKTDLLMLQALFNENPRIREAHNDQKVGIGIREAQPDSPLVLYVGTALQFREALASTTVVPSNGSGRPRFTKPDSQLKALQAESAGHAFANGFLNV